MPKPLVYGQPHMTLQEVADVMGITAPAVRKIEQQALAKLRRSGKDLRVFLEDSDDKSDYTIHTTWGMAEWLKTWLNDCSL